MKGFTTEGAENGDGGAGRRSEEARARAACDRVGALQGLIRQREPVVGKAAHQEVGDERSRTHAKNQVADEESE